MITLLLLGFLAQAQELHYDAAVDVPLTLGAGSIWTALYLGSDRQDLPDAFAEEPGGIDALAPQEIHEGPAAISDYVMYGSIGLGAVAAVADGWDGEVGARLGLYVEAFALNGAVTEITKYAVRRPRPYTFGGTREGGPDDDMSFFSGHTSTVAVTTFTTARAMDLSNDLSTWQRVGVYGGATLLTGLTAGLRVAAGKHFPSDVIVGALVGGSIGWLVPELHRSDRVRATVSAPRGGGTMITVGMRW